MLSPALWDSHIALYDIDGTRLKESKRMLDTLNENINEGRARITGHLGVGNRRRALQNTDYVINAIQVGGYEPSTVIDFEIPKKFGLRQTIGDTLGIGGIFRGLRTIPVVFDFVDDMEAVCPDAWFLNYVNPMAMVTGAIQRFRGIKTVGLCHSYQMCVPFLLWPLGMEDKTPHVQSKIAGINHMAWYTRLEHKGKDLYPKLKKVVSSDKDVYNHEQVRNEMFLALGYYVTESSGHNSEYNWWFRKRPDLVRKYCRDGTGWNPGQYAYILKAYQAREGGGWQKSVRDWINQDQIDLRRGHEYAASIINAYMGGDLYRFNGNVANDGLIDNLPTGSCVEVPVLASSKGLEPVRVGSLPASVAMLTGLSAQIEMMAVDGCLKGDAELVYQAIAHDPLTAAKLSLAEIRKMVREMFKKNQKWLPQFKKVNL